MNDTNTPDKTLKAQSPRAMHTIGCFYAGVTHHLCRHRGFYGFVSGIAATLLTLWAILWYGIFAYPLPWKITDPMDPRFNPEKFRFTDYENSGDLGKAIKVILPLGTHKSEVDKLMLSLEAVMTAAKPREKGPKNLFYYKYWNLRSLVFEILYMTPSGDFSWEVAIEYDEESRIRKIVSINP